MLDLGRLNAAQKAAVLHGDAPLLVLAGAGTGKTTAVTYRIANLIETRGVLADRVLAVTFTNKAAREMRERAAGLLGLDPRGLDIGTFHGTCGRILRRYGHRIGLSQSFLIYDADDQLAMVRRILSEMNVDTQVFPPQAIRHRIEQWKNQGQTPDEAQPSNFDMVARKSLDVYRVYQKQCITANAVDFGDLLLHTVTLLKRDLEVRAALQARWTHVLVDEYQDTNPAQYAMLKLLVSPQHSLTVVGDDDQSIYRWRGADIGNILRFERDFEGSEVIRLEQNYRSTQTILNAANAVIARNTARKGKTLFTEGAVGDPLRLRLFATERDEGEAVGDEIVAALGEGESPDEVAVLYRTNAQSRAIEDALRRRKIPYAVYGGVRFYDRREIKDALAYLRLVSNPLSDVDFLRVINAPARGLGKTSLENLADVARQRGVSLYVAAGLVVTGDAEFPTRAKKALTEFVLLMEDFIKRQPGMHLGRFLEGVLEDAGYLQSLRVEGTDDASDRIDNLAELVAALDEYMELSSEPSLAGFLEETSLATDVDGLREGTKMVSLMTLHSAKGLEFGTVFLPGLEEGLFPHSRSFDDRAGLEEERRLCYVALTRAKRKLHLSAARSRTIFGEPTYCELSRFVAEIPSELLILGEGTNMYQRQARAAPPPVRHRDPRDFDGFAQPEPSAELPTVVRASSNHDADGFGPGTRVFHASFGEGRVLESEGAGKQQKLTIDFPTVGRKVIVARFVDRR